MEILRGTISNVVFALPTADTTVTANWQKGSATGPLTVSTDGTTATAMVPYQQYDGQLVVNWELTIPQHGSFIEQKYYEVVTPLLSDEELMEILDDADEDYTIKDARKVERSVRHIIQAHTGQTFGKSVQTVRVHPGRTAAIELPARLLRPIRINGYQAASTYFRITGDGWYLNAASYWGVPPIRADIDGYNVATYQSDVPIQSPPFWSKHQVVEIEGEWGWHAVPEAVKEAARLLVNDYATDTVYRDRYLTSMSAADWRIQFSSGAFAKTGNVRADQLLSEFVLTRGWAVL